MSNKAYYAPGNPVILDETYRETIMKKYDTADEFARATMFLCIRYLSTYCIADVPRAYYDKETNKSFITQFRCRLSQTILGQYLRTVYGNSTTYKEPFMIEYTFDLTDNEDYAVSQITIRWAKPDWSTPRVMAEPEHVACLHLRSINDIATCTVDLINRRIGKPTRIPFDDWADCTKE